VFAFENITLSDDGSELSATCVVAAEQPFFAGHFPGTPIMPAVAQLQMIEALLHTRSGWQVHVRGGSAIKFLHRIVPGSKLDIRLAHRYPDAIRFTLEQDARVVTKGTLQAAGVAVG